MVRRHGHQVDEMETGAVAEEETGDNGGGNGAGHGGEEHGAGKIAVQFLQGKHHARQRRIESGCQTGAGTAGDEVPLLHAGAAQKTGNPLARHGADLDGGPLPSKGKACTDTHGAGNDFHPENADPFHLIKTKDDTLHLGNAGTAGHGGIAAHGIEEKSRHHQGCGPEGKGQEIFLRRGRQQECVIDKNAESLSLSQKKAEKADAESAENTYKYAFNKQTEAEFVPVVQSDIGLKELPVQGLGRRFFFHDSLLWDSEIVG